MKVLHSSNSYWYYLQCSAEC